MSDEWSIVSGEYSDLDVSESGFAIIPTLANLVTSKSQHTPEEPDITPDPSTQAPSEPQPAQQVPAAIIIASPPSEGSIKKVVEWLNNSSANSKLPVDITTVTKPKILPGKNLDSVNGKVILQDSNYYLTRLVSPHAYTLSILDPQKLCKAWYGNSFSLGHHPESWSDSTDINLKDSFSRI
jgi:hypothetical protein